MNFQNYIIKIQQIQIIASVFFCGIVNSIISSKNDVRKIPFCIIIIGSSWMFYRILLPGCKKHSQTLYKPHLSCIENNFLWDTSKIYGFLAKNCCFISVTYCQNKRFVYQQKQEQRMEKLALKSLLFRVLFNMQRMKKKGIQTHKLCMEHQCV